VKILQTFYTPTPETPINPPWFVQRPILYSGFFLPEVLIVIILAATNIRTRFLYPRRNEQMKENPTKLHEEAGSTRTESDVLPEKVSDV